MNIELMKKIEDLKLLRRKVENLLIPLIDDKQEQYTQLIRDDFSKFFSDKGFIIKLDEYNISATYGNLTACLSHDRPNELFPSTVFMFDLDLDTFNKTKYSIFVGVNAPSVNSNASSSSKSQNSQNEIDTIQKYIDEANERITNFTQEVWKLFIKEKNSNYVTPVIREYASISDFFNDLFE